MTLSYLELYIVISPEKQGYGVTTDATAVHSSMHRSLEDVVLAYPISDCQQNERLRHTCPSGKLIAEAVEIIDNIVSVLPK
jgi:hypothetical protein